MNAINNQATYLTPYTPPIGIKDETLDAELEVEESPSLSDRIMIEIVLPDLFSYTRPITNLYPSILSLIFETKSPPNWSEGDLEKIAKINTLIEEVKPNLGLEDMNHSLYIDLHNHLFKEGDPNFSVIGMASSYEGPVVAISKEYFANFVARGSQPQSFYEAQELLNSLPNDPFEMGAYLDQLSEIDRESILKKINAHYRTLTTQEIKGILAHELGHAKQHHNLRQKGANLIFTATALSTLALFGYLTSSSNIVSSLGSSFIGSSYLYKKWISRLYEYEADQECASQTEYLKGIQSFLKRHFVHEIAHYHSDSSEKKNPSCSAIIKHIINSPEDENTHPHSAKRLQRINKMIETSTKPASEMARTAQITTQLGYACVYGEIALTFAQIKLSDFFSPVSSLFTLTESK